MKLPQCYQTLIINMPIISAQSIILRSGHEWIDYHRINGQRKNDKSD
jgi:hypothetical protein